MAHDIQIPVVETVAETKKRQARCRSFFSWAQLLISLSIPLAIIVYTVIQNNNDLWIDEKNREQDLKLANETRFNDLAIAEANRQQDLAIAKERYEHDLKIAQQQYAHDVELAAEEQEEAILVNYFDSLAQLLKENGMDLSKSQTAGPITRMKTLNALSRLSSKRKSILVRALIESGLIKVQGALTRPSLSLSSADLTGLNFTDNVLSRSTILCVYLADTTLTNSYFRNMILYAVNLQRTRLHNSDLSGTTADRAYCPSETSFTTFASAILDDSTFESAHHVEADFYEASLARVQMHAFQCRNCDFRKAIFDSANMSHATFDASAENGSNFRFIRMNSAILYHTNFYYSTFSMAIIKHTIATFAYFNTCDFFNITLVNSSLVESTIVNSKFTLANIEGGSWARAKIINTSFTNTKMNHVNFNSVECHRCLFHTTDLLTADFTNAILVHTDFTAANVTYAQLKFARTLENVTLPNGTLIG